MVKNLPRKIDNQAEITSLIERKFNLFKNLI